MGQMSESSIPKRSWVDLLVLFIAFTGAVVSFLGVILTYISQVQIADAKLWPLPGAVLIDWILAGSLGFISVFFCLRKKSKNWLRMTWLFTGAFIPIMILGALSISAMVFIAFLLSVTSTGILALRNPTNWLLSFGLLMLGSIGNLAILMGIITLSGQTL
jgi:hypothetical protein